VEEAQFVTLNSRIQPTSGLNQGINLVAIAIVDRVMHLI
jgi:hypothetical protein